MMIEGVEINTKVDNITRIEIKREGCSVKMIEDLLTNFNETEKKISKGKISTTKMKKTKDLQVTKITEEKIKESRVKDNTESRGLSSKKTRNQKKEETITRMTNGHTKETHAISENRENIKNIKNLVINLKVGDTMMSVTISEDNKNGFKKM